MIVQSTNIELILIYHIVCTDLYCEERFIIYIVFDMTVIVLTVWCGLTCCNLIYQQTERGLVLHKQSENINQLMCVFSQL